MLRLRRLRPRELRSIRHWAIELAVVVVGVLLALWAAEWAEGRREAERMALAEIDIREELRQNFATLAIYQSFDQCKRHQIGRVYNQLVSSEEDWGGIEEDVILAQRPDGEIIPGFYSLPGFRFTSEVWDAALATGLLNRMDRDRLAVYGAVYEWFGTGGAFVEEELDARANLSGLVPPGKITAQVRIEALGRLQRLEASRNVYMAMSEVVEVAAPLELGSSRRMEERLAEFRAVAAENFFKPCYRAPDNPLAEMTQ
ncbi:hypothetical protein [Sphingomicrobium sediminis]|uniref:Uncharacterized protein n=1 Tax=Sphingomicrobium sediminis TaxID=2950949 RepID=A0A9X2EFG8_9SPHN|nr:hypothetical protein [Sphingomicrobium sediminis]MCM8556446.1 hypothetical protein [Sphingomicrobium sediminis]